MKNILTILFLLKYLLIISQNNNKKSSVVIKGGGEIKTEIKFNNSVKIGNQQTTTNRFFFFFEIQRFGISTHQRSIASVYVCIYK